MQTYRDEPGGRSCPFLCVRFHSKTPASPKLPPEITRFDEDLARELEGLKPKEADGAKILTLKWLSRALIAALNMHEDAVDLVPPLDHLVLVHDEKWMNLYMDQTKRMLDVCNALAGAISNVEQGHLLIRHACHVLLDANKTLVKEDMPSANSSVAISEDAIRRAHKSLQEWVNVQVLIEQRSPKYSNLLREMISSLRAPKDRDLSRGKGFLHALYGANALAVFAFYVSSLAFFREGELRSLTLQIPPALSWSPSISDLEQAAKDEVTELSAFNVRVEDIAALDSTVKNLSSMMEKLLDLKDRPVSDEERTALSEAVSGLRSCMDEISKGLEDLGSNLNGMLKTIVSSRSALLNKLGDYGADGL